MESRRFEGRSGPWLLVVVLAAGTAGAYFLRTDHVRAGEPPYFAIRGARIVTGAGPAIDNGTVVMAKGLITAVGKDVPVPPEAWVIDGKGLTVYPGLIDAMSGVGLQAAPSEEKGSSGGGGGPARQVTSRGPEDRPNTSPWKGAADELKPDDKRVETWRAAGFTTTLSIPEGGLFPGQGAVIDLAGERPGEMVVKTPAALGISLTPTGGFANFPGSLMGAIAYVKQVYADTEWYEAAEGVYQAHPQGLERPAYDRTEVVIAQARRAHVPVLLPANNSVQLLRGIWLAQQLKVPAVFYGGQEGYTVTDALAASKIPVLVNLKWPEKEKDADPDADTPLRVLRFRDRAPSTPAAFEKAGIKFAFYSGGITTPKDILKNAKKAIDAGLKPDAALRALTLSAAEIFGIADRLGSIEAGKIANLVLTDGDLFNEKTKVKEVFVDGRRFQVREPEKPKEPPKGNLTGKWTLSYTTPEGPETSTVDITMATDGSLTGTFSSPQRGMASISDGWLSGDHFSFTFSLKLEEGPTDVSFSGTLEGNSIKGTISVSGLSIDFTGTRPGAGAGREESGEQR